MQHQYVKTCHYSGMVMLNYTIFDSYFTLKENKISTFTDSDLHDYYSYQRILFFIKKWYDCIYSSGDL